MKTFLLRSFLLLVFMLCCQTNNATSNIMQHSKIQEIVRKY